jgi:hypothetical protein
MSVSSLLDTRPFLDPFVTTLAGRYLPIPAIFDCGIAAILDEKTTLVSVEKLRKHKKSWSTTHF